MCIIVTRCVWYLLLQIGNPLSLPGFALQLRHCELPWRFCQSNWFYISLLGGDWCFARIGIVWWKYVIFSGVKAMRYWSLYSLRMILLPENVFIVWNQDPTWGKIWHGSFDTEILLSFLPHEIFCQSYLMWYFSFIPGPCVLAVEAQCGLWNIGLSSNN